MSTRQPHKADERRRAAGPDALPSWRDGETKRAILRFVEEVTDAAGTGFVPESERVAVFDNDGTLWCEQPMPIQVAFGVAYAKLRVQADPALAKVQPYQALLTRDLKHFAGRSPEDAVDELLRMVEGLTPEEFEHQARAFLETEKHPCYGRPYLELAYVPMRELLDHLRAHGFRVFLVSGGGADFMRAVSDELYGVHRDDVIGTLVDYDFVERDERLIAVRKAVMRGDIDEGLPKVANIQAHVGRRPLLACGNSQGDAAMLRYVVSPDHPHLALLINHDDGAREYEYAGSAGTFKSAETPQQMAERYGWTVVSMRRDFERVYAFD